MARIRSIKPDFFTSETVALWPLSTRLTFIGLWTYVDDNGVGIDNELLITASIWPLETDPTATVARTREDLATLSRAGVISRYQDSRKRYLHVTGWKEHQKVDHPGKPRYPLPDDPAVTSPSTCVNSDSPDTLAKGSRGPRESVAPEQGAGSREQGAGNLPELALLDAPPGETQNQRVNRLARVYTDKVKITNFNGVAGIVRKAVNANCTDDQIARGLLKLIEEDRPLTADSLRIAIYGSANGRSNGQRGGASDDLSNEDYTPGGTIL